MTSWSSDVAGERLKDHHHRTSRPIIMPKIKNQHLQQIRKVAEKILNGHNKLSWNKRTRFTAAKWWYFTSNPNLVQKLIGNPIIYFSTLIKGLKTDLMQFSHCALESGLLGTWECATHTQFCPQIGATKSFLSFFNEFFTNFRGKKFIGIFHYRCRKVTILGI